MADAALKVISTVDAKLSQLAVKNGQLIFAKDTHSLYLDMGDIRTPYRDITIIQTDSARQALLALPWDFTSVWKLISYGISKVAGYK